MEEKNGEPRNGDETKDQWTERWQSRLREKSFRERGIFPIIRNEETYFRHLVPTNGTMHAKRCETPSAR